MARAHNIYLVRSGVDGILAAFTVKHEAETWVHNNIEINDVEYWMESTPDGSAYQPIVLWDSVEEPINTED